MIHGFGGNADHWRKNTPELGRELRAYSIDLLGYGFSDKPDPRLEGNERLYTFDTWSEQIADFAEEIIQEPCFLICNSIGGIVGLKTAVDRPDIVKGVQLLNLSLRLLHIRNQPPLLRPLIRAFQDFLRNTPAGLLFFNQVVKPDVVRKILEMAYHDPETVTDELVDLILKPGLEPGAARVFLSFISYSGGPLPLELLQDITQPVSILWGTEDPWEKIELGRPFAKLPSVEEFIEIPDAGHCVMCENSEIVNPLIKNFVQRHVNGNASL